MKQVFQLSTLRFSRRAGAMLCAVLACSSIAIAQNDESEIARARDDFFSQIFTKCSDGTHFFGPHEVNHLGCTIPNTTNQVSTARKIIRCAELIEYTGLDFAPAVSKVVPPKKQGGQADLKTMELHPRGTLEYHVPGDPPDMKRVLVILAYTSSRSRVQVTSSRLQDTADVTQEWNAWEQPIANLAPSAPLDFGSGERYLLLPGTKAVGLMVRRNGHWTFLPGPDFPLDRSITQILGRVQIPLPDVLGEPTRSPGPAALSAPFQQLMGTAGYIEKIRSNEAKSCDLFPPEESAVDSAPIPAGTRARRNGAGAIVITSNNGRESSEFRVTFTRTGTPFMLAGFTTDPKSDWRVSFDGLVVNGLLPDRAIKIRLDGKDYGVHMEDPQQKRLFGNFIESVQANLKSALQIAANYNNTHPKGNEVVDNLPLFVTLGEGLSPVGVRTAGAGPARVGVGASLSSQPEIHSLNDTYERAIAIINDNDRRHIPDPLRANEIPNLFVCSAIVGTGQCRMSGEVVRVPGDLAEPLDWKALVEPAYCISRRTTGVPVVLKSAAQAGGGKRLLRCSDAQRLAAYRDRMIAAGVRP